MTENDKKKLRSLFSRFLRPVRLRCQTNSQMNFIWIHIKRMLRTYLSTKPRLFSVVYGALPKYKGTVVSKKSEIVIEGYPRSGNTFAVVAFCHAQEKAIRVARHQHSIAQILLAKKYGIPCIVIIRKPEDAIISYLIREQSITISEAIRSYTDYYNALHAHKNSFVIAKYEDLIGDFNTIIRQVNKKYACQFREYCPDKKIEAEVFSLIAEMEKKDSGLIETRATHIAMPDKGRQELKKLMRSLTLLFSFEEAEKSYYRFIENITE